MRFILLWMLFSMIHANADAQTKSWYRYLSGTIAAYPVTMHLYKTDHSYSGYYYYNKSEQPIHVSGSDTGTVGAKINLLGFDPAQKESNEVFTLVASDSTITGVWQKNANSQTRTVLLKAITGVKPVFEYIFSGGSKKLRPALTESPEVSYEAASVWPGGNGPADIFLKNVIRNAFGEKNGNETIGNIFLEQKKSSFKEYFESFKEEPDSSVIAMRFGYMQEETKTFHIVWRSAKLISFALFSYAYTGGAHGNYGTNYIVADPGAKRTLQTKDIFTGNWQKTLNSLLDKYFRKTYGLKAGDSLSETGGLFENKIEANDNFCITSKGIMFSFNPYEIGPYALGEISIFIPFAEMNSILHPGFKKLLQ